MLRSPSAFDVKASGVGLQVWKIALNRRRKSLVGSQCAGRDGAKAADECHDMV